MERLRTDCRFHKTSTQRNAPTSMKRQLNKISPTDARTKCALLLTTWTKGHDVGAVFDYAGTSSTFVVTMLTQRLNKYIRRRHVGMAVVDYAVTDGKF